MKVAVASFFLLCSVTILGENKNVAMMLDSIREMTAQSSLMTGVETIDPEVMRVMAEVDRKLFVPKEVEAYAYINQALPIRSNQTISQPFIVALMTHLLKPEKHHRVLEIGTGSGYQAAILSELVEHVFTIEIIPNLATEAQSRLQTLGFDNVDVKTGDGWFGWEDHAPFDSIVVTAQSPEIPQRLVDQLKVGGRMVIPVGTQAHAQTLEVVEKVGTTKLNRQQILSVVFVPMTGEAKKADRR